MDRIIGYRRQLLLQIIFFSEAKLSEFLNKHANKLQSTNDEAYFVIENDGYISSYLNSLTTITDAPAVFKDS